MRTLQKILILLLLLSAMAAVPACGKKGPLYLPTPAPAHAPAKAPASTSTPSQDK